MPTPAAPPPPVIAPPTVPVPPTVPAPAGPPARGGVPGQPASNGDRTAAMPTPARVSLRRAAAEGEQRDAVRDRPTPPPRSPLRAEESGDNLSGWLADLRPRPDGTEADGTGTAAAPAGTEPANGRPGEPGGRSFFEPASGRSRRMSPLDKPRRTGDRAVPPTRLGQGGQAFPRRRPLNEPVREEPTRAFRFNADETTRAMPRPAPPADETTRAFPTPAPAGEPAVAFHAPVGEPAGAFPTVAPGDESTQALPRRRPPSAEPAEPVAPVVPPEPTRPIPTGPAFAPVEEPEEVPTSVVEPASGPPAARRGFSPIVIEGTVIESRDLDLAEPVSPAASAPAEAAPWAGPSTVADAPAAPEEADPAPDTEVLGTVRTAADPVPAATPDDPTLPFRADDSTVPLGVPADPPRPAPAAVAEPVTEAVPAGPVPVDFLPANEVEEDLLGAAGSGSTDTFLSTLLLARVLLPVAPGSVPGSRPGEPGFVWHTEELDGETYVVVYTSPERLADRADGPVDTVLVRFVQLIRRWPDENWSFAVNPGTPVGAKYPGEQVVGLANWAAEVGLGDDAESEPEQAAAEPVSRPRPAPPAVDPTLPVTMQKAVAPSQLAYYLERGYDRVSGFVHRANELAHLNTPAQLYDALGLGHPDSPFTRDAGEIYVLRWPAHRPSLYRIPYGGQNEAAMRAMEGWVIERPPFRGNGFAPGESSDVVAEFKVDSARLPHGAQLWRIGADGSERVIAILDTDALLWRQVGAA
ncbi:SseB family protein [Micromonospora sp. R77]|uniref:SseB family protein n=1 Tax=Micromonospora sp. R77 TaxID=2925836 RepID=UPI001F6108F6|nr:SseB family protein [Micromonospora sp. R77]